MTVAVEARDLFRVHTTPQGDSAALQGLTLTVADGEIVTVLGPSGSGKTSFLRIVAGLDRPSAGTARVYGVDLGRAPRHRLASHRAATIGYVEQHYARALTPELSVRENVALRLALAGAAPRERRARADELLERVDLRSRGSARPAALSGGEQQRIAVCAALAHRPRLLLADEPTGELDEQNAARIYELIDQLVREHGCTALIVSHDPASASIADRTVRIRDGRVSEEATRASRREEMIVVGRGGWLRVPDDLLQRAGIGTRARARLEAGSVVLTPATSEVATAAPALPEVRSPARPTVAGDSVSLNAVSKVYGQGEVAVQVLDNLTASFASARYHVVTGPSGSGKTTLLQLAAGLELPTSGDVELLGQAFSRLDREARARIRRDHVGVVSQQSRLVPFLSAFENVDLALAVRKRERPAGLAVEALSLVGLSERATQRVSALSSGEQARVAVARALVARPALLLADEPTARLDQANSLALASLFRRLADAGVAVICATHDPLLIEQADRELSLPRLALATGDIARQNP